jgi:hypothetical protein
MVKEKMLGFLGSVGTLIILSILDSNFSGEHHAHNPLGSMTGTYLMLLFTGPIILLVLFIKKSPPTKKKKKQKS